MEMTDDQMRQLLEQQQQVIDALLQTRAMLTHQMEEASSGLAQQMATLSFKAEQPGTGRKKRREFSTSDDDMRTSSATHDSWATSSAGAVDRASSAEDFEGLEEDEIVYRSCGAEMNSFSAAGDAQWQYEEAQRQNEEAQRQNCDEQVEILSQIGAELAAGTSYTGLTTDHSAVSATMARLLELSARLSAAREVSKALMGEESGEEAAGDHQMGSLEAF
jgi:hypothetical protein